MSKTSHTPRRDFLKMIPVALISLGVFSFFKVKKSNKYIEERYHGLSKVEADEMIKNNQFLVSTRIKPAPAPVAQKSIQG
ncbi:MAG: hypothetical protein WC657_05210 [Candidatus Paceibacterota bacterium]|jgi:hypothetical protein